MLIVSMFGLGYCGSNYRHTQQPPAKAGDLNLLIDNLSTALRTGPEISDTEISDTLLNQRPQSGYELGQEDSEKN